MSLSKQAGLVAFLATAIAGAHLAVGAEHTRSELKIKFQDGDIPTGQDFADFIDSSLNLLDDGLTLHGIGVGGPANSALRLDVGEVIGPLLTYAPSSTNPAMAPLWLGQFGFLPLEYQDASLAPHYGFLQLSMAAGPLPAPPGSPGAAIFVEYLVWETDANSPLTTSVVPEPSSVALMLMGAAGLVAAARRAKSTRCRAHV